MCELRECSPLSRDFYVVSNIAVLPVEGNDKPLMFKNLVLGFSRVLFIMSFILKDNPEHSDTIPLAAPTLAFNHDGFLIC